MSTITNPTRDGNSAAPLPALDPSEQTMQGKVCLVTGGTNGIGREVAFNLARLGAIVVVVGRNAVKGAEVVAAIKEQSKNPNVESMTADLSLMSEVRKLADIFKAKYQRLDVLINNAGAIYMSRTITAEGLELTFSLNHLAYFLLTDLLLDLLKASTPSRIVNVASEAHEGFNQESKQLNFDDLQSQKHYSGMVAYGRSKLANIMFTYELARRLEGTGVTVNALHPGVVRTGFGHNNSSILVRGILWLLQFFGGISSVHGASTPLYLAVSDEVTGVNGKYWDKRKQIQSSPASYDEAEQKRLWEMSEQIINDMTVNKPAANKPTDEQTAAITAAAD